VIAGMHVYSPAGAGFGASERAMVYAWTGFERLGSAPGTQPAYAAPWPMFHGRPDDRPTGSGGRLTDVCLTTPDPSRDRLECRLDQLDARMDACATTVRLTRSIGRARHFLAEAGPQRARKMLKRAARAFLKAERVAGLQLVDDCRSDVQARLHELGDIAARLSAAAMPR
jgi:hypothetical protein